MSVAGPMMPPSRSSSNSALPLSANTPLMPAPLMRADILAMASADAALGLRYMPPMPRAPLGVPAQQQFFVPPVPAPSPAPLPQPDVQRSRGRRSAAAAGAPSSSALRPTVPGGGWGKAGAAPAPTNAAASSGSSCGTASTAAARAAAAKRAIAEASRAAAASGGNRGVENAQARAVTARLSAPSSRRGSASGKAEQMPQTHAAQLNPELQQQISEHERELNELRAANLALKQQMESSKTASKRGTPRHSPPRTPRSLSRAHSQPGSRLSSPRGSAPTSPRTNGARTPRRLALAQAQAQAAEKERVESEASAAALTESAATSDLLALRAARADLLAREFEERARLTEEQAHRPHYYLHQAREEVKELKGSILPLLAQADQALSRITAHAAEAPSTIRSRSLAHTLSKASATAIARNADDLADRIMDHLLLDTISELNSIDSAKSLDARAAIDCRTLSDAWEVVEEYERVRAEMEAKYAKPGEHGKVRQHLPEVAIARPTTTAGANAATSSQFSAAAPSAPTSASSVSYASQHHSQAAATFPSSLSASGMRSTNYPPPSTFQSASASSSATAVAAAAPASALPRSATHFAASSASPTATFSSVAPPPSARFAVLPALPSLVSSVQSDRAAFEKHVALRNQQQFLMPHQLQLHTIVAAAGDDILDSLLSSVCAEVGSVCDSYVERVFDAEFAVADQELDMHAMAEMDWREQQEQQREAQHRELDEAAGFAPGAQQEQEPEQGESQ